MIHMDDELDYYDDDYPCNNCSQSEYCDGWEAQFCCALCRYNGFEHCDDCDPMNI